MNGKKFESVILQPAIQISRILLTANALYQQNRNGKYKYTISHCNELTDVLPLYFQSFSNLTALGVSVSVRRHQPSKLD